MVLELLVVAAASWTTFSSPSAHSARSAMVVDSAAMISRPIIDYSDADVVWLMDRVKTSSPQNFQSCIAVGIEAYAATGRLRLPNCKSEGALDCSSPVEWRTSDGQLTAWRTTPSAVRSEFVGALRRYVMGTDLPEKTSLVINGLGYGSGNGTSYASVLTRLDVHGDGTATFTVDLIRRE
jgi:hypothetical protein